MRPPESGLQRLAALSQAQARAAEHRQLPELVLVVADEVYLGLRQGRSKAQGESNLARHLEVAR